MFSTKLLRAALTQSTSTAAAAPIEPAFVHLPLTRWPRQAGGSGMTETTSTSSPSITNNEDILLELPSDIFHAPSRLDILHQCVVAHLAGLRQGTAHTKNRAEVRGSNRKIQRQKGSGRARVGDVSSPIRRGGGRAFPKRQRDFSLGLNAKVWKMGIRTALSERWRRGELSVIPTPPTLDTISTRTLASSLATFPDALSSFSSPSSSSSTMSTIPFSTSKILFLVSSLDTNFAKSARNLPNVKVELVDDIDVFPLLQGDRVILDLDAVQQLDSWLGRRSSSSSSSNVIEEEDFEEDDVELASSPNSSGPPTWPTEDGADSGAVYSNDPEVIEEEEAPVIWRRYPDDPLKREDALKKVYEEKGAEYGDRVRDHMEEIGKQKGRQ